MNGGRSKRRKWGLLVCHPSLNRRIPVAGADAGYGAETDLAIGCTILGLLATPLIAYAVYENLPSRRGKERLLNGEFYAGGFMGVAFTPSQNLNYLNGFNLNTGGGPRSRPRASASRQQNLIIPSPGVLR